MFEVRQGYKSADSKRQNADLRSGMKAYQEAMLPSLLLFSTQHNYAVDQRYRTDGIVVLVGTFDGGPYRSSFEFIREVVGFDLPAFFQRASPKLRAEVGAILEGLVSA